MKKLLSLLLALALLLSMAGCADAPEILQTEPVTTTTAPTETTPTTTPDTTETVPATTEADLIVPPETRPVQTDPPETTPAPSVPPQTTPTVAPTVPETEPTQESTVPETQPSYILDPNGSYTTRDDVALFIRLYGRLPNNFITKSQARAYGWRSGSLERFAPGKCIGGDVFRNQEGLLPSGHTYYECDIDTLGSYSGRGSKRIVYSSDGLIYYTSDHYRSFTLLYGEP